MTTDEAALARYAANDEADRMEAYRRFPMFTRNHIDKVFEEQAAPVLSHSGRTPSRAVVRKEILDDESPWEQNAVRALEDADNERGA